MKKICYLTDGLANGGIHTFVANVISGLDKNKWDISLIMSLDEDGSKQFREDEMIAQNIAIYRTNDLRGLSDIYHHARKLYRLLKEIQPDVVHSNASFLDGVNCFVAKLAGVPVRVSHSHNTGSHRDINEGKSSFQSKVYHSFMRKLIWIFSNRYCGCSEEALDYLHGKKWRKSSHAAVINNAIDLKAFQNVDKITAMRLLEFDSEKHRVVTVGRLAAQKNPLFTVEIFSELRKLRSDCELIWIGTGPLEDEIKEKIKRLELQAHVQMLGKRKDVKEVLTCCDVFVLPSLFEGLGIVLIEAQAAGLPCVASTGIPELANCGTVIRLPLEEGARKFAQTISDILDQKIVVEIDEEKLSKFDIPYMVGQLERVYEG